MPEDLEAILQLNYLAFAEHDPMMFAFYPQVPGVDTRGEHINFGLAQMRKSLEGKVGKTRPVREDSKIVSQETNKTAQESLMIAFAEWIVPTTDLEDRNADLNPGKEDASSVIQAEEELRPKGVDKATCNKRKATVKARKDECFGEDWETSCLSGLEPPHALCAGVSIRRALMLRQGQSSSKVLVWLHRLQV